MNINTILDILLNQRLGLAEYKLDYLYPEIHKNLLTNTLPIFSQYFPYYRRYTMDLKQNKTDVKDEYYINIKEIKENNLQIISVAEVTPRGGVEAAAFKDHYRPIAITIEDVIMNSMVSNMASMANYSFRRFRYLPPNKIRLRGYGSSDSVVDITFKLVYPSFSAIPDSVIEQFLALAEADIKIYIYNKLKHYDQLSLPVGNIDLKLNIFENGEDQRKDVINRFETEGFPQRARKFYHRYE